MLELELIGLVNVFVALFPLWPKDQCIELEDPTYPVDKANGIFSPFFDKANKTQVREQETVTGKRPGRGKGEKKEMTSLLGLLKNQ